MLCFTACDVSMMNMRKMHFPFWDSSLTIFSVFNDFVGNGERSQIKLIMSCGIFYWYENFNERLRFTHLWKLRFFCLFFLIQLRKKLNFSAALIMAHKIFHIKFSNYLFAAKFSFFSLLRSKSLLANFSSFFLHTNFNFFFFLACEIFSAMFSFPLQLRKTVRDHFRSSVLRKL